MRLAVEAASAGARWSPVRVCGLWRLSDAEASPKRAWSLVKAFAEVTPRRCLGVT